MSVQISEKVIEKHVKNALLDYKVATTDKGFLSFYSLSENKSQWEFPYISLPNSHQKISILYFLLLKAIYSTYQWERLTNHKNIPCWKHKETGLIQFVDPSSKTYLIEAAILGNIAFLLLYLKSGGIIELTDQKGLSPLHYACANGHDKFVQILCQFQADLEATDNLGSTPLFYAVHYAELNCVKVLLSFNVNLLHQKYF